MISLEAVSVLQERGEDMGFLIFIAGTLFGFISACVIGCAMINGKR